MINPLDASGFSPQKAQQLFHFSQELIDATENLMEVTPPNLSREPDAMVIDLIQFADYELHQLSLIGQLLRFQGVSVPVPNGIDTDHITQFQPRRIDAVRNLDLDGLMREYQKSLTKLEGVTRGFVVGIRTSELNDVYWPHDEIEMDFSTFKSPLTLSLEHPHLLSSTIFREPKYGQRLFDELDSRLLDLCQEHDLPVSRAGSKNVRIYVSSLTINRNHLLAGLGIVLPVNERTSAYMHVLFAAKEPDSIFHEFARRVSPSVIEKINSDQLVEVKTMTSLDVPLIDEQLPQHLSSVYLVGDPFAEPVALSDSPIFPYQTPDALTRRAWTIERHYRSELSRGLAVPGLEHSLEPPQFPGQSYLN